MAATISDLANGTSITSNTTVVTGATVTASVGDWLVVVAASANAGTNGAASMTTVVDSDGLNTYTQRALINYDPGAASAGATLGIYTCAVTNALSNDTITVNHSVNTPEKAVQVYKLVPASGETISFISADTTGVTGNATSHTAAQVSVLQGRIIIAGAAIETDDTVTGDSDTTNGSWSTILTRLADNGADAATMASSSQYKTVTATGNQDWACTTASGRDSARTYIILESAQPVTPGLVTNSQTFYAPTVTPGAVALTPGLFTNDQTFYAPTVTPGAIDLTPGLITNSQTFYAPTVAATYELAAGLFTNDQTFFAPTVTPGAVDLTPGLFTNTQTFHAPTVSGAGEDQALTPGLVTNTQTFYAPTVDATYDLAPALVTNTQTFYDPTVSSTYGLSPGLVTNDQVFYAPSLAATYEILPGLVTNTQVFYAATMDGGDEVATLQAFWPTRRRRMTVTGSRIRSGRRGS